MFCSYLTPLCFFITVWTAQNHKESDLFKLDLISFGLHLSCWKIKPFNLVYLLNICPFVTFSFSWQCKLLIWTTSICSLLKYHAGQVFGIENSIWKVIHSPLTAFFYISVVLWSHGEFDRRLWRSQCNLKTVEWQSELKMS